MSKELTEKWKNGELDGGIYYLLLRDGTTVKDKTVYVVGEKQLRWHYTSFDFVKEVLAPVPSYEEWHKVKDLGLRPDYTDHIEKWEDCAKLTKKVQRLQKQLDIAKKALNDIEEGYSEATGAGQTVRQALESIEEVK
jgi:hypothetical protein